MATLINANRIDALKASHEWRPLDCLVDAIARISGKRIVDVVHGRDRRPHHIYTYDDHLTLIDAFLCKDGTGIAVQTDRLCYRSQVADIGGPDTLSYFALVPR